MPHQPIEENSIRIHMRFSPLGIVFFHPMCFSLPLSHRFVCSSGSAHARPCAFPFGQRWAADKCICTSSEIRRGGRRNAGKGETWEKSSVGGREAGKSSRVLDFIFKRIQDLINICRGCWKEAWFCSIFALFVYLKVFILLCNLNLRIRLESLFSLVFVRKDGPIREAVFYLDIKTAESRVTIM